MENFMQGVVMDRPVLDQTGIEGRCDFHRDWTPDEFQFSTLGSKGSARAGQRDPSGSLHGDPTADGIEAGSCEGAGRRDGD